MFGLLEAIELNKLTALDKIESFCALIKDVGGGCCWWMGGGGADIDTGGIGDDWWWFCWIFNGMPDKLDVDVEGLTGWFDFNWKADGDELSPNDATKWPWFGGGRKLGAVAEFM